MSSEAVRVAVRARPLIGHEREAGACSITNKLSKSELVLGSDRVFSFNHVFGPEDEQELVFTQAVSLNGSQGVVGCFSRLNPQSMENTTAGC